ncbi:MAG: hypothetical protein IMZ55_06405 [Acidobacteria bacterium]|nr:hypothetical protein [Acidobacteriota bacterium]
MRVHLPLLLVWLLLGAALVGWSQWKRYWNWANSTTPSALYQRAVDTPDEPNEQEYLDRLPKSEIGTVLFDKPTEPTERTPGVLRMFGIHGAEASEDSNQAASQ